MKQCTKCKKELDENMFFFRNKEKKILHSICKDCKRNIDNIAYAENRHGRKTKIRDIFNSRRSKNLEYVNNLLKSSKCKICGDNRYYVLDFHHRERDYKLYEITSIKNNGHSLETIKKEINKCDILCSNCHRELHHNERMENKLIN